MKKKIAAATILTALLASLLIGGCGNQSYADMLYEHHNPYVGNHVKDSELFALLDLQQYGYYTLELQTEAEPYVLTFHFTTEMEDAEQFDRDMQKNACVLLALIDNLSTVTWTYPNNGKTVTQTFSDEMASARTGEDISNFSASAKTVQSLLDKLGLEEPETRSK